jgi:5'-3' exonuclease
MSALYLIDGTFEIFRCFHAAPKVANTDGQEVGACRAFFHTMASLLREEDLTHVAIAFDSVVSRVSRSDRSDSALIRSQFPIAANIARAFGMTVWPMSRFQADDALATGAFRWKEETCRVVICSNDNDFAQCVVGDRVILWNRIKKTRMNERDVISKFGVRPAHIPEYLAMVGDPSDGLPGIPGFGPKATTALINRYGHLEDILKSAGSWDVEVRGKEKLADTLIDRGNEALLYRNLSMLRTDVPLPERLEDLVWQGADRKKVEAVVETMEDPSLHERTVRYR